MELLKNAILREAEVKSDQVLLLDSLINHQLDPAFIMELGKEFAGRFRADGVTKVVTMESSGISLAFCTALELGVPLIFARRKKTLMSDDWALCERVPSFAKGMVTDIIISGKFLTGADRVLLIDDIIANGDTARGIIRIIERSEAALVGMGVAVEKSFQPGAASIREQGIRVESLVSIASLEGGEVRFGP